MIWFTANDQLMYTDEFESAEEFGQRVGSPSVFIRGKVWESDRKTWIYIPPRQVTEWYER